MMHIHFMCGSMHTHTHTLGTHTPEWNIKLQRSTRQLCVPELVDALHKLFKLTIDLVAPLALALLFLELIWVIHVAPSSIKCRDQVSHLQATLCVWGVGGDGRRMGE